MVEVKWGYIQVADQGVPFYQKVVEETPVQMELVSGFLGAISNFAEQTTGSKLMGLSASLVSPDLEHGVHPLDFNLLLAHKHRTEPAEVDLTGVFLYSGSGNTGVMREHAVGIVDDIAQLYQEGGLFTSDHDNFRWNGRIASRQEVNESENLLVAMSGAPLDAEDLLQAEREIVRLEEVIESNRIADLASEAFDRGVRRMNAVDNAPREGYFDISGPKVFEGLDATEVFAYNSGVPVFTFGLSHDVNSVSKLDAYGAIGSMLGEVTVPQMQSMIRAGRPYLLQLDYKLPDDSRMVEAVMMNQNTYGFSVKMKPVDFYDMDTLNFNPRLAAAGGMPEEEVESRIEQKQQERARLGFTLTPIGISGLAPTQAFAQLEAFYYDLGTVLDLRGYQPGEEVEARIAQIGREAMNRTMDFAYTRYTDGNGSLACNSTAQSE